MLIPLTQCQHCLKPRVPVPEPPTLFCVPCTVELRAEFAEARRKSVGKNFFSEGAPLDHKTCPPTFVRAVPGEPEDWERLCAYCGSGNLSASYGFTPYGLGGYLECDDCRAVLDFTLDTGN